MGSMDFTESEIQEFKTEAFELLDAAEQSLIALDRGDGLATHYNSVFRAFQSIKGAAGMMEILDLQSHMHQLENFLVEHKSATHLDKNLIDLFLRGLDACRSMLNGQKIDFDYGVPKLEVQTTHPAPVVHAPTPTKSRGRVMVVDDEPEIVEILCTILEGQSFETCGTTDPTQVETLVQTFLPETVFTDMSMPKLTGLDILAQVKKFNADIPVIFVSAHITKEALMEAIQLGVFGAIEKPFDVARIIQICHHAVRRYQLMQLFNKPINLLLYQYSDLSEFLTLNKKHDLRDTLSREITEIIHQRRLLRGSNSAA